jgi:eukaryotic-like serine/threonine-protein kinase
VEPAQQWMSGLPQPGNVIAEKYRVERLLGRGGMGAVFAATHVVTGKTVAIKWLLPEATEDRESVQRFVREAQAAARIRHPNVVDIYDVGLDDRGYFLVMEYLEGEPLSSALQRGGYTAANLVDWLMPAIRALAAAHRAGVVHRDLKPANIFLEVSPEGGPPTTKLLDFGIAKVAEEHGADLTRSGTALGTPQYMAPEQIRGMKNLDHRVDIYALGVLLYHGLTRRKPFAGDNYGAVAIEVATARVIPPREHDPNLDPGLEAIVLRAMSRDPDGRFARAEDMAIALAPYGTDSRAIGSLGATPFHLSAANTPIGAPSWSPGNPAQSGATVSLTPPSAQFVPNAVPETASTRSWLPWLALGFVVMLVAIGSALAVARFSSDAPAATPAPQAPTPTPSAAVPTPAPTPTPTPTPPPVLPLVIPVVQPVETEAPEAAPEAEPTPARARRAPATRTRATGSTRMTQPARTGRATGSRTGPLTAGDF